MTSACPLPLTPSPAVRPLENLEPQVQPSDAKTPLSTVLRLLHTPLQLARAHSLAKRMCHVRKEGKRSSFPQTLFSVQVLYTEQVPPSPPRPVRLETIPSFCRVR